MKRILIACLLLATTAGAADDAQQAELQRWSAQAAQGNVLVIRGERWVVPPACLPPRELGSEAAGRDLGSDANARELGSGAAARELGSANNGRELGAANQARELGSANNARELGSANAGRELGAASEARDLGSANASRELGSDAAARELGAANAARELGSDAGARDLGAADARLRCVRGEDRQSVVIHGALAEEIRLPADSKFRSFVEGEGRRVVRVQL